MIFTNGSLTGYIEDTVKNMEKAVKQERLKSSTEHTLNILLRSRKNRSLHYVPFTVRLRGVGNDS